MIMEAGIVFSELENESTDMPFGMGSGAGVIFGGGNASVFGSSGAGGLLAKMTAFMAVLFIVTSLSYNYVSSSHKAQESTILDVRLEDTPKPAAPAATVPATPAEKPAEAPAADKPAN